MADLVKLSDEDAELLAPGQARRCAGRRVPCGRCARGDRHAWRRWCHALARGARGADRGGAAREVVDTIGAGDTFTAGLSVSLLAHGVEQPAQLGELGDEAWRE
jgi:fructokinase